MTGQGDQEGGRDSSRRESLGIEAEWMGIE